jgi:ubiquinol-cytochrome c reductase cytochrome b subunit
MANKQDNVLRRIWRVIDDRTGLAAMVEPLLFHDAPPNIGWPYVLGSATLFVFALQVLTGLALATAYIPTPADAYHSLQFITHQARFGNMIRGMHFYGASAMVILISLHAMRTYLYGSYKFPREANWLTGVLLLGLTLAMAWTGQLLRWDENGFWTVVVGANVASGLPLIGEPIAYFILAGETVDGPTLSRFFVFHVLFMPLLIMGLIGFHIYLMIRNGISEPPEPGRPVDPATYRAWYHTMLKERGLSFWPHFAWRDAVFGLVVISLIVAVAYTFGAVPLEGPPDPTRVMVHPEPDWYFRWYDSLLTMVAPQFENVIRVWLPLLLVFLLLLLPFVSNKGERSPWRRPWAILLVAFIVVMFIWLTFISRRPSLIPDLNVRPIPAEIVGVSDGPVVEGAQLFYEKGCLYCHAIDGHGGRSGPELTYAADRLPASHIHNVILNGAPDMPAYLDVLTLHEFELLLTFLESRRHAEQ